MLTDAASYLGDSGLLNYRDEGWISLPRVSRFSQFLLT